jgi:hypothetical protein
VDSDIKKIRKILNHRNRGDLADLLKNSTSNVNEGPTFGSKFNSVLSVFEIYSPLKKHEKLKDLSNSDRETILDAIIEIYPVKANAPEIKGIEFYLDFENKSNEFVEENDLQELEFDYLKEQIEKCEQKINAEDYDGAITNARSLVESVCIYILEDSESDFSNKGDLINLHKQVKDVLKMDPSIYNEDFLKQISSGFFSIINGLASLRNELSDAHGKSKDEDYTPSYRHAILAVNSAKTISEYLYNSWKYRKKKEDKTN